MGRKISTGNALTEAYSSPDETIQTVGQIELQDPRRKRTTRSAARRILATQVKKDQVHPLLWDYLKEHGAKTEGGHVDKSVISFEPDYHVTPESETIDSVIIYATPEQKQAADNR